MSIFFKKVVLRGTHCHSPPGLSLAAVVAVCLIVASPAWALTIDDFSDGTFIVAVDAPWPDTDTDSQSGLTDVIGGQRDVLLTFISDTGTDGGEARVENDPPIFQLKYENDPNTITILELEYGLGADLDADFTGDTAFFIDFLYSDLGASVDFEVITGAGSDTVTHSTPAGPNLLMFGFAEFSGVDMADVDQIHITINPPASGDYRIDLIGSLIPEPLTMAGLFMGITGLAGYVRKRRMV